MKEAWEKCSIEQIVRGWFADAEGNLCCVECGKQFDPQEIFSVDGKFYTAQKAVELHLQKEHPQRLEELLEQEKKLLSLTDKQEQLLLLFSQGISDQEIARQNGTAVSTVRHQRFVFRERAKAAKIYLAAWEMMQQGRSASQGHEELISIHGGATMVDSRYEITQQKEQKILQGAFSSLDPLKLKTFSPKEKKKIVILRRIAQQFTAGQRYTEKQVNEVLKEIFDDYVTLRRYLIEYGFLKREKDGSAYWKEQE